MYDLETNGLLEQVSTIHCMVTYDLDTGELRAYVSHLALNLDRFLAKRQPAVLGLIPEGLAYLNTARYISGHNIIRYDNEVLDKLHPGAIDWSNKRIMDTLVAVALVFSNIKNDDFRRIERDDWDPSVFPKHMIGKHGLEAWGARLGFPKDDYSHRMKERGLDPWAELNEDMLDYCVQDVVGPNLALWKRMRKRKPDPRSIELEMEVAQIIWEQEKNGFPFDERGAGELYAVLSQRRQELLEACAALFPPWWVGTAVARTPKSRKVKRPDLGMKTREVRHKTSGKLLRVVEEPVTEDYVEDTQHTKIRLVTFNPASRDHVSDRFMKLYGWEPTEFGADGKPTVDDDILQELPFEPAKLLAEYYLVEKRLGMLSEGKQAWLKAVRAGRIHGRVNTNGAITGRATHSNPNVAQVPSTANANGPVPYGHECRSLFTTVSEVPALAKEFGDDWVLVGCDASGLELRCLAHFMSPFDGGAYGEAVVHGDVHTANMNAAGLATRQQAKTFIYAFLYGAGPEKIGSITGVTPAEIEKYGTNAKIAERLRKQGRTPNPTLVATIRKGELLMASFLKKTPALKKLRDAVGKKYDQGGVLKGLDGRELPCRSKHSALNTLLQSAGALLCKRWMIELHRELKRRGWKNGVHYMQSCWAHDELQIQCRKDIADELGRIAAECVSKAGEYFGFRVPLAGEYKIGRNWAETH